VRTFAVVGVVAALLAAGCAGPAEDGGEGLRPRDVPVDPASTFGVISGVVVDETIRPVAGAQVSLLSASQNTTTDEDGLFSFTRVQPGFHALAVSAPLHVPTQATADVVAGQTAKVKVQLQRDLSPQPYHVTLKHDGFMQAWAGIGQFFIENVQDTGTCDCRLTFQPDASPTTFIFEATWDESPPNPLGAAEFYWIMDEPDGDLYEAGYCTSPCLARINAASAGYSGGAVTARLDGPDEWVQYQTTVTLYVTAWYVREAPDGWSFVQGG
jgi:hypothetical protein